MVDCSITKEGTLRNGTGIYSGIYITEPINPAKTYKHKGSRAVELGL